MIDGYSYRFETKDQWGRCLRMRISAHRRLAAERGELLYSLAEAPRGFLAGARDRFAWIGNDGMLRREPDCPGPLIGAVTRLIESGRTIWALANETLSLIDAGTLQLLDTLAQPGSVDLAPDGMGGAFVLTGSAILHLNARGRLLATLQRPEAGDRIAAAGETLYLLDASGKTLLCPFSPVPQIDLEQVAGEPSATFTARDILSGGEIVLLTGGWNGTAGFLAFDAAGDPIFSGVWETGGPLFVTLLGNALVAVFDEGGSGAVRLFENAAIGGGERRLTPVLESDTLAGEWRRADLRARLPKGATLTFDWAATADEALAALAQGIFDDDSLSHDERRWRLRAILPWSDAPVTYTGELESPLAAETFAAPLSEASETYLWLEATILRNAATEPPEIVSLVIEHDRPGLMDNLPAVYRTETGDSDGTLHRLVEVLEATFLGFDAEIGKLGDRLDPDRTEARWLASLAQLLGLPFDDALDSAARRALLRAAPEIIARRGTRAGVQALLTTVLGDRPYRILDRTEQFIPVTLGGGDIPGTPLPAFLTGPSARVPKLNARLVLGRTPLGMSQPSGDGLVSRSPELLVVVPVTGAELRRLGAALRQMIETLIPAGVRLDLHWTDPGRASGGTVLGVVDNWPTMTLGEGMRPGAARLGGSCEPRLREGGISAEHRLA